MKKLLLYLNLICLLFASSNMFAQNETITDLQNKLAYYASKHLNEKIYIHTDKSTYLTNELCWFKIYSMEGFYNTPLDISSVCYIEILNQLNEPVLQEKISMSNGMGDGSVLIPNNLQSGHYTIRAYTNWMKNFDPAYFFSKQLNIINTQIPTTKIKSTSNTNSISIFPESGNLMYGINTKVGIKVKQDNGKNLVSNGWIIADKNDTIASIKTGIDGIGSFNFTPTIGHQYFIKTITNEGNDIVKEIPTIQENGYHLTVKEDKINNQIHIEVYNNLIENEKIFLLIHSRAILKKVFTLNHNKSNIIIKKEELGEGVNTITLFDNSRKPVSERLYFNYPTNKNLLQASTEVASFKSREKVNLKLQGINNSPNSRLNLSLSVYKIDSLQGVDETNIQNYIWLQSDLTEKIEHPYKYFDTTNLNRFSEIDDLMLTNGWSKFKWDEVLLNKTPLFNYIPELGGNIITGKLNKPLESNKNNELIAAISIPSKYTQYKGTNINQHGVGIFEFRKIYNDGQIILQVDSTNNKSKFILENPFYTNNNEVKSNISLNGKINEIELNNYFRNIQTQQYYNPNLVNQFKPILTDSNAFYGKADRVYLLDNYSRFATLEEVIREYVTPVSLNKTDGKFNLAVYDEENKQFFKDKPLLLLDGVMIKDVDKFLSYDPLKIRKLEVVSRLYFEGNNKYKGIINFTTYEGKMEGYELDPSSIVLDYKGLQASRIFAAPLYDTEAQIENRLPDFRHLLYWNPSITINSNDTQQISLFTSDLKGKYLIAVQGISNNGVPVYKEIKIEVRP